MVQYTCSRTLLHNMYIDCTIVYPIQCSEVVVVVARKLRQFSTVVFKCYHLVIFPSAFAIIISKFNNSSNTEEFFPKN